MLYALIILVVLLCIISGVMFVFVLKNSNKSVRIEELSSQFNRLSGEHQSLNEENARLRENNSQMANENIRLKSEYNNRERFIEELNNRLTKLSDEYHNLDEENSQLTNENTRLKSEYANHKRFMDEKLEYIEKSKNEMVMKFRDISNEILKSQTQQINENQKSSLNMLLNPFKEQLKSFKDEMDKANTENTRNKLSFDEQFKKMVDINQNLSQDAQNLASALRGNKKMQGNWGEIELNRILEISGLQKNIDYRTQVNFKGESNQNLRPDVIVDLPNNRKVIIDSKVSMNDYINYVNAEDEQIKTSALAKHIECIKHHIKELSNKEYQKLLKSESLDYVIIFIPIETAFLEAIKNDDKLYDLAYQHNVALTTPSSLIPILRTIENLWRIENQNKYVEEITEIGTNLYNKLADFANNINDIGTSLENAQKSYNTAIFNLVKGNGNALATAHKFEKYGIKLKSNKKIRLDYDKDFKTLNITNVSEEKVS